MGYFELAMTVLPYIMELVQVLETQTGMTGPEKFAAAMQTIATKFPQVTQNPATQARISGWINMAVELFNVINPLFKKTATVATPTVTDSSAVTGVSLVVPDPNAA